MWRAAGRRVSERPPSFALVEREVRLGCVGALLDHDGKRFRVRLGFKIDSSREQRLDRSDYRLGGEKLERNRQRDKNAVYQLLQLKWRVLTIWECETKQPVAQLRKKLKRFIGLPRDSSRRSS